jgi:hypothetical protein
MPHYETGAKCDLCGRFIEKGGGTVHFCAKCGMIYCPACADRYGFEDRHCRECIAKTATVEPEVH